MFKKIAIATVFSAAVFGSTVLPVQATPSQSDCAYAKQMFDAGAGPHGAGLYNPYAVTVQECR